MLVGTCAGPRDLNCARRVKRVSLSSSNLGQRTSFNHNFTSGRSACRSDACVRLCAGARFEQTSHSPRNRVSRTVSASSNLGQRSSVFSPSNAPFCRVLVRTCAGPGDLRYAGREPCSHPVGGVQIDTARPGVSAAWLCHRFRLPAGSAPELSPPFVDSESQTHLNLLACVALLGGLFDRFELLKQFVVLLSGVFLGRLWGKRQYLVVLLLPNNPSVTVDTQIEEMAPGATRWGWGVVGVRGVR